MKTLLLFSQQGNIIDRVKNLFSSGFALFTMNSLDEAIEFMNTSPANVVLVDSEDIFYKTVRFANEVKRLCPNSVTICFLQAEASEIANEEISAFDFVLQKPLVSSELRKIVQKAFETYSLTQEVALLREQLSRSGGVTKPIQPKLASFLPRRDLSRESGRDIPLEQFLSQFARALSAGFDLDKMLNMFLDTVNELARPSRISLFLYDKSSNLYRMEAYRGFSEQFAKSLKLPPDEGLPKWLLTEGRVISKSEVEEKLYEPTFLNIRYDMETLKAVVSIPLCSRGSLIGILNLGEQVTGIPYANSDMEILFTLASHTAVAVQDISYYHQLQEQKNYIENILKWMSSGVITINKEEQIIICNQRAYAILQKEPDALLHKDLRYLPSPLGDMLFGTLRTGKTYEKVEVAILPQKLPLEITTYPIRSGEDEPIGSVMVFDDISSRKQLAGQRRKSEQLELVNRIVERIAHGIKNPLVSIRTFLELYEERFDDKSFREELGPSARRDLERLNGLLDQLTAVAAPRQYHFELADINELLKEYIALLREESEAESLEVVTDFAEEIPPVKCDKEYLKQAFGYLMRYLINAMEKPGTLRVASSMRKDSNGADAIHITMTSNVSKISQQEREKLFDILAVVKDTDIDLGPCASQKIIEDHGGRVKLQPEKAREVGFVIDIPPAPI